MHTGKKGLCCFFNLKKVFTSLGLKKFTMSQNRGGGIPGRRDGPYPQQQPQPVIPPRPQPYQQQRPQPVIPNGQPYQQQRPQPVIPNQQSQGTPVIPHGPHPIIPVIPVAQSPQVICNNWAEYYNQLKAKYDTLGQEIQSLNTNIQQYSTSKQQFDDYNNSLRYDIDIETRDKEKGTRDGDETKSTKNVQPVC